MRHLARAGKRYAVAEVSARARKQARSEFFDKFGLDVVMVVDSEGDILATYKMSTRLESEAVDDVMKRRARGENCALVAHILDFEDRRLGRVTKWDYPPGAHRPVPGDPDTRQVRVEEIA